MGSLVHNGYDRRVFDFLKSLNVNENFLKDSNFLSMKKFVFNSKRNFYLKRFGENNKFVPIIKDMLREANIPQIFLYLAMAESTFVISKAQYKKQNAGIWQLNIFTAQKFGLRVDNYVDERLDPIKSTKAAINYLKHLYVKFDKWYLALLAYNSGEGTIQNAIQKAKSEDLNILLSGNYLSKTNKEFIGMIVALSMMGNSTKSIFNGDFEYLMRKDSGYQIAPITLKGGVTLKDIAKNINVNLVELQNLNKHLNNDYLPPYAKEYQIYIPSNKLAFFKSNVKEINKNLKISPIPPINLTEKRVEKVEEKKLYIVRNGDTLNKISKQFKIPLKELKQENNLKSHSIKAGDKIVIPN